MSKYKVYFVCLVIFFTLLVSCSSDVNLVKIKASNKMVDVGEEVNLTAIGFSSDGMEMELDIKASWVLGDPNMGVIKTTSREQAVFIPEKEGTVSVSVFVGDAFDTITFNIGEKILAIKAIDFVNQGGGIVQFPTDREYPCFSHWNNQGHWLEWNIDIPKNAYYTPLLMYSTGANLPVYRNLSINGELVNEKIEFPNTGGFGQNTEDWQMIALDPVFIEAGQGTLRMENIVPTNEPGMNLAWIALIYPIELTQEDSIITTVNKLLGL